MTKTISNEKRDDKNLIKGTQWPKPRLEQQNDKNNIKSYKHNIKGAQLCQKTIPDEQHYDKKQYWRNNRTKTILEGSTNKKLYWRLHAQY